MKNKKEEWYCVICGKFYTGRKDHYSDLGSFNSAICKACKDTDEAKESLGLD